MPVACPDEPVDDDFLRWTTCVASTSNKPAASGAGGGCEPSTCALKGPPTRFLLHYKADMKQTASKELKSPADTPAKCLNASPESLAPLSLGTCPEFGDLLVLVVARMSSSVTEDMNC